MATMVTQIVRGLITVATVGACVWMWVGGGSPPTELVGMAGLFAGTYFKEASSFMGGQK